MKVFLESHNITNKFGGFGTFNYELIHALSGLDTTGLEITLNSKYPKQLKKEFKNTFNYSKYKSFERYPLFRKKTKYDVWHSLNQNTKVEPFFKPKKYILTVHDVNFMEEIAAENKNHEIIKRFKSKIERADIITYVSEYSKNQTHHYFNVKNKPEYVIYNGNPCEQLLDTNDFSPTNHPLNQPFFFSIGDFLARKNFLALVQMMEKMEDHILLLAGNDDKTYGDKIRAYIKDKNLENKVFLLGKISNSAKQYYLKNCTAFLFPSIREGFGLPPIEAMKFGKPVFLSNLTSLPEIGADVAFYWESFNPDTMKDFLFSKLDLFSKNQAFYTEKLKTRADFFSWEKAAKDYLRLYRE